MPASRRPLPLLVHEQAMLEVTADDIAALADDDLRTLVGLLCEAELRKLGLPTSGVTWGGHQDAADGGIDVRVDLPAETLMSGFIPRAATGFQVKKPDMAAGDIAREMQPNGILRPSIQSLADREGAYIIVCSTGSLTDTALTARRKAMTAAANDASSGPALTLDFYDRTRVATWVREHPGLIPWVRRKAGRQISGWQSYGPWSNPDEAPTAEFLTDDACRIRTGAHEDEGGLTVIAGIVRIRKVLATSGSAVRLVGLSGVGKTRLVQALFDPRVGAEALDPALALYANTNDEPDPVPVGMVSDLVVSETRAIVIVDNCRSDLHRRLVEVCKGSAVSVITVEYDIREDQPEGTEVFSVEPSSIDMTEKVLRARFRDLSQVDTRRIAEVSGGNFRVALALASTIERGDSVSGLTDDQLFDRLFRQRQEPDAALLRAAEACSLLYSFDGEAVAVDGELARLAKLVGQEADQLYARVAELRRRDLVQARSIWRAVLPHAIANRLARRALQNIPMTTIEEQLVTGAPDRMKRSFSRRLGYLHDNKEAESIVGRWLKPGGFLSSPGTLDDLYAEMLANVAPVAPEAVLAALEGEARGPNRVRLIEKRAKFVRLLRSLAHDAPLFERCAGLLADFAAEDDDVEKSEAARALTSLFLPYLSGTHATVGQRICVMEGLVRSGDPKRQSIGVQALAALLEAMDFLAAYEFEFGSRSRDYGYSPSFAEVRSWYAAVLKSAEALARSGLRGGADVPFVIASSLRGLWSNAQMYDDLERVSRSFIRTGYWMEGWIAVRETLNYSKGDLNPEAKARLVELEKELRPRDLLQKVRSIVFSQTSRGIDFNDYEEREEDGTDWERTGALVEQLGVEVINDADAFKSLLPEVLGGSGRLYEFGMGFGSGTVASCAHWQLLREGLARAPEEKRNVRVLVGFLHGLSKRNLDIAASLLDHAVTDPLLGPHFPALQCAVPIDARGVGRLIQSLDVALAPIEQYRAIAWGRNHEKIGNADLRILVTKIGDKPNGVEPALEIVFFRLFANNQAKQPHDAETIEAGRELLSKLEFARTDDRGDHHMGLLISCCLSGSSSASVARIICERFKAIIMESHLGARHYTGLLEALCKTQPTVVLDSFLTGNPKEERAFSRALQWFSGHRKNPLDVIADQAIMEWCNQEPDRRYPAIAAVVSFLKSSVEDVSSQWSDRARTLIERAPDPVAVARKFVERFRPMGWSGSLASILEGRKALLEELKEHTSNKIAAYAIKEAARLAAEVEAERKREAERDRGTDERFE